MGDFLMARITNEVLYTEIKNIKQDTTDIKKENKEQWKAINQDGKDIAKIKGVGTVIAFVFTVVGGWLGFKQ